MNTIKHRCKIRQTDHITFHFDFGEKDQRGRKIGASITRYIEIVEPLSDAEIANAGAFVGYNVEPGHYFGFRPRATRDGKPYGATQPGRRYATDIELEAALKKYLHSAEQRAGGNFV